MNATASPNVRRACAPSHSVPARQQNYFCQIVAHAKVDGRLRGGRTFRRRRASAPLRAAGRRGVRGRAALLLARGHHCGSVAILRTSGLSLLVAGCARGLADNLRNLTIPTLHQLHDTYRQDAAVYVFDDDPLDRQRSMPRKWAHRRRYVRLILANEYTGSERIQRLVVCRNTLVHEARQVLAARGVFLMLDLDVASQCCLAGSGIQNGCGCCTASATPAPPLACW